MPSAIVQPGEEVRLTIGSYWICRRCMFGTRRAKVLPLEQRGMWSGGNNELEGFWDGKLKV